MVQKPCYIMQHMVLSVLVVAVLVSGALAAGPGAGPPGDHLALSGLVANPMGKGLKEVEVEVLVNGRHVKPVGKEAEIVTGKPGGYVADFLLPGGTLATAKVEVKAAKPSWKPVAATPVQVVAAGVDTQGNRLFQGSKNLTMERTITAGFWIASLILLLVYLVISFEWMHRTLVSFLGAALIVFITYTLGHWDKSFYIISFDDAMGAIDLNVIFLLMGMMLFVGVMKKTGMFQFLAFKAYALARGNIFVLSLVLQIITAVVSAFLDNVTTMLLVLPVTIEIAVTLKINPLTLLVPEAFASNVGGTATLIGDPPNILIGSYAGLTFGQFVQNLTLVCAVSLAASSLFLIWWHKKEYLKAEVKDVNRTIEYLKEEYQITNKKLMTQGLILLALAILFFILGGILHLPVSIPALLGSLLLLAISGEDIVEMLEKEVEWPTLVFFIGLFMVIAGAEETGLIQVIANFVKDVSKGNLTAAIVIILWVSAIASAFIDNIPFTATMLPIIAFLNHTIPGAESGVLWWSLSLGACLGGNGTMIGASANVVTVGLAEKAGYHISFVDYMKACWWPMMITVTICMVYLLIAY
jgi:Na+/H+ antiporter NhaD/arsenite permease-like protein